MIVKNKIALALFALFIGAACATKSEEVKVKQISQKEAYELMQDTGNHSVILDVRTQEEFKEGHIPGAICVPVETIGNNAPEQLPDKNQMILVYCRSGNRSRQAALKLVDLGYMDVREFGGINSWPYEVTKN